MKKSAWIIAIIALAISACTSQKHATTYVGDEVYNTSSEPVLVKTPVAPSQNQGAQVVTSPDLAKGQKPASSTFADDYNDYSYANRIDRFSSKDTTVGYFDKSYTGSATTGTQGGNNPNVNIYLGNDLGYGSYYAPSLSFGFGYPYSVWGWDYGWGYPYYGGFYGYGLGYPYYYGGYYPCCYCNGYNDWYNPYYTSNSYYYGSRSSTYRTDGRSGAPSVRATQANGNSAYSRNERSTIVPSPRTAPPTARTTPVAQEKYRYTRPATSGQTENQRSTTRNSQVQNQMNRQQPAPRYAKPENVNAAQQRSANVVQSYSSPVYRQPKSSQEYLAPRSQNPGTTRAANPAVRAGSGANNVTRQSATPDNSYNRSGGGSNRSGSSGYSTPSRSSGSGSTRSGGSNSSPSGSGGGGRSGGGNSGGSSSGGSGGGGGRHR